MSVVERRSRLVRSAQCLAFSLVVAASATAQESRPASRFGRTSIAFGGGITSGAYEVSNDSGDVRLWYTKHTTFVASGIVELRHQLTRGLDVGARVSRAMGSDKSTDPVRVFTSGFNPPRPFAPYDTARTDDLDGMSYLLIAETRWVGLTAGVSTGHWVYASDYPITNAAPADRSVPVGAVRVGPSSGWHAEAGYGRHLTALAPRPVVQAGLARGSADESRLLRFGAGPEGVYVGGRFVTAYLLELESAFTARSPAQRQFTITVKQRLRVRR